MTDTVVNQLIANIGTYRYNPSAMQRQIFSTLEQISNGDKVIVDPTNPFVFGLESACCLTAGFMMENAITTRQLYPIEAQTQEDVYKHMSDIDYLNRFSTPSVTTMNLLISKDEVINRAVATGVDGTLQLTIPRNTYITVAGIVFSMQYPIVISVLSHGGLQIVYDATIVSPLQTLTTNVVPVTERINQGLTWLCLAIPMQQFDILSQVGTLNQATGFSLDVAFNDNYYFTRVYLENADGSWYEIDTTHSALMYDITKPTAVLKVSGQTVNVSIPQIYTNTMSILGGIRIDVYETKGPLSMDLSNYDFSRYVTTFLSIDTSEDNQYVAPLKTFHSLAAFNTGMVSGGSLPQSFATLRDQVINNSTSAVQPPITNVQLAAAVNDAGYALANRMDDLWNRVFVATRALPPPDQSSQAATTTTSTAVVTGAACSISTVALSFTGLSALSSVINNGPRMTITPDTLYENVDGVIDFLSDNDKAVLLALPVDQRGLVVSGRRLLYTPFHYVLDSTGNEFASRPYYLDGPEVTAQSFVDANSTTQLQVTTGSYELTRQDNGYRLRVVATSNDGYKALSDTQVFVQLAYIPPGERDYAYLMGVLSGFTSDNERVFDFSIDTVFDVNSDDQIVLNSFLMYSSEPKQIPTDLSSTFQLFWSTSANMPTGWKASPMDPLLGLWELPARITCITEETMNITFGSSLDTLWARSRSVISSVPYKTYQVNVPWLYAEDVYQRNADGSIGTIVNGVLEYTILHHQGDPVLDSNNQPTYQYVIGDTILDANNQPIPASTQGMTRQCDLLFIEGVYYFATDVPTQTYRQSVVTTLVSWLTNDLETLSGDLLQETKLYFYPQSTLGDIEIMFLDGLTTTVPAGQSFNVNLYVTNLVNSNDALKAKMTRAVVQTISGELPDETVAISDIEDQITTVLGTDIVGMDMTGFGLNGNLTVVTVTDKSTRMGIRKQLVALPDNTLSVQDAVTVNYIVHELQ